MRQVRLRDTAAVHLEQLEQELLLEEGRRDAGYALTSLRFQEP